MKVSLFVIESPFQLLQAFELIKVTNTSFKLLVRLNDIDHNNKQLVLTCKHFNLKNVEYIRATSFFQKLTYFTKVWLRALRASHLYIGDIDSFVFRKFKKFLNRNKVTLLDDGVATINQSATTPDYRRFSIFPIDKVPASNDFTALKKYMSGCSLSKSIDLIIGGKVVEEGICSKNSYHKFVEECKSISDNLIYIPHRGESEDNLTLLEEKFSLKIIRLNLPVELVLLELKHYPKKVYSCFSTALISMPVIYPQCEFYYYELPEKEILCRKQSALNVYNFFEVNSQLTRLNEPDYNN